MNKIIEYLEQLDLSEIEAQIYLSLLKTGPLSVREIAKTVGIKRTSVYMHIDRLIEKSLIIKQVKGSKTQIVANEPKESIKGLVEQKVENDKLLQQNLPNVLGIIEGSISRVTPNEEAEIRYYKGRYGVRKIYEDALNAKELRSYVNISEILNIIPENFKLFDSAIKKNSEMMMYEIVEDSKEARERASSSSEINSNRYFFKIFPKNMRIKSTDILIYDNKVSIINLKDSINGIILRNMDLYKNFKMIFDFIWKMLPDEEKK